MPRIKRMKVAVVKRRFRRKRISVGLKRYISKAINRRIETKSIQYHESSFLDTGGVTSAGIFYNLITTLNNSGGLDQGTAENQRIGDVIMCRGISLRLYLLNHDPFVEGSPFTNNNYSLHVRIVIFKTKDTVPTNATLFRNGSFPHVQVVDTDRNVVLYDRTVVLHGTYGPSGIIVKQADIDKLVKIWLPGRKCGFGKLGKLKFQDNDDDTLKGMNLWMAMFPGYAGDGGIDPCMNALWNGVFYFKDA